MKDVASKSEWAFFSDEQWQEVTAFV